MEPAELTALQLLQAVYRNPALDLHVRLRAARDALPFESPKLAVVAQVGAPGGFAERLERAMARVMEVKAQRALGRPADGQAEIGFRGKKPEIESPPQPLSAARVIDGEVIKPGRE